MSTDSFRTIHVTRVRNGRSADENDRAATEEPLEVRLHGRSFAVIMRTPGADRELAAGFLLSERVLQSADDLGSIEYCTDPGADSPQNVVNVMLSDQAATRLDALLADRRQTTTNSSCGMCGRLTIDSLRVELPPLEESWRIPASIVRGLPDALRSVQKTFEITGGLHAAGLFAQDGRLDQCAEDVGRHNAVDKVIGRMLMREQLPLSQYLLFVSGRTSFEIVQKAFLGGIPLVAAVSAPSTLAIELAEDAGVTLIGFVRGDGFNLYTHAGRVSTDE